MTTTTQTMRLPHDARSSSAVPPALAASSELMEALERAMRSLVHGDGRDVLGDICAEQLATGGKRLRARLALAASTCFGLAETNALSWAVACEVLHNATLVHDDLQDGDRVRRGHLTTWAAHGAAQAINAGDLMLMAPYAAIDALDVDGETKWALSRVLTERAMRTVRGQAAELHLRALVGVNKARGKHAREAYRRCIEGKTGELFALPVEGAALLAGRAPADAEALAAPFLALGMLFQLQDDVLDLYGDKGRGGPDARGGDLYEGKISALVVEELHLNPRDAERLLALLDTPRDETPADDVARVIAHMREHGALDAVLAQIHALVHSIESAGALSTEPALRRVALELIELILAPIRALVRAPLSEPLE